MTGPLDLKKLNLQKTFKIDCKSLLTFQKVVSVHTLLVSVMSVFKKLQCWFSSSQSSFLFFLIFFLSCFCIPLSIFIPSVLKYHCVKFILTLPRIFCWKQFIESSWKKNHTYSKIMNSLKSNIYSLKEGRSVY